MSPSNSKQALSYIKNDIERGEQGFRQKSNEIIKKQSEVDQKQREFDKAQVIANRLKAELWVLKQALGHIQTDSRSLEQEQLRNNARMRSLEKDVKAESEKVETEKKIPEKPKNKP